MADLSHAYAFTVDLDAGLLKPVVNMSIGAGDSMGDTIAVTVKRGGAAVTLSDVSCKAYFIRADGGTVYINGSISGNVATVTLPEECYAYDGAFSLSIKLEDDDFSVTMLYLTGAVILTDSGRVIDPGTMFPSYTDLMAIIANKIDEPAEEGENGMVLTTDGNGGRTWQDIAASTVAGTLKVGNDTYTIRTGTSGASGYLTIVTEA